MTQNSIEKSMLAKIRANDVAGVERLLEQGCAAHFYDMGDAVASTPLHLAVGKDVRIMVLLLAAGAQPNAADDGGMTPLMMALAEKDYAGARALVAQGADINWQEAAGKITALHSAVFATNRDHDNERLRMALMLGADAGLTMMWQGHQALTPRALAVMLQGEGSDIVDMLDRPDLPERRLVAAARSAFMSGLSGRAHGDKQRYVLK